MASQATKSSTTLRHNRDYWWLWFGQNISLLGDEVFNISILLWIATVVVAGESWAPLAVVGVMLAGTVPVLLFSLIAGVYADRWNRRRIMLTTDAVRFVLITAQAGVVFAAPLLSRSTLLAITYTIGGLVAVATQFFNPARFGMLAMVVDDSDRERAASIATGTAALAGIIGPSLGAVLLVTAGAQWAMLVNAASFAVSFVAVAMMRTGRVRVTPTATETRPNLWRELAEGFRYLAGNHTLRVVLGTAFAVSASSSCLAALEVFFVTQNLHASPEVFGILATVAGIGALVGAAVTAAFGKRLRATAVYAYSLVAIGLLLVCYSRTTSPLPAIVVMFVMGLPLAAMGAMTGPLLMRATPEHLLGRISTAFEPVTELSSMVTMAVAAWLASTVLHDLDVTFAGVHFGAIDTILTTAGFLVALSGLGAARAFARRPVTAAPPEQP